MSTSDSAATGPSDMQIPDRILCIDCLGECARISFRPDDDPFVPGDVVAYRCRDCLDRWDIVLEPEDFDGSIHDH